MEQEKLKKPRIRGMGLGSGDSVLTSKGDILINLNGSEIRLSIYNLMSMQPGQSIPTGLQGVLLVKETIGKF